MFKSTATTVYVKAVTATTGLATLASLTAWIRGS